MEQQVATAEAQSRAAEEAEQNKSLDLPGWVMGLVGFEREVFKKLRDADVYAEGLMKMLDLMELDGLYHGA